jgi:hypothetical protein
MKRLSCLLALLWIASCASAVFAAEKATPFRFDGYLLDYEWAHSSNRLALLISSEKSPLTRIVVLDAERMKYFAKIRIPDKSNVSKLAWLSDDSGFLLAAHRDETVAEDEFMVCSMAGEKFNPIYGKLERLYTNIESIAVDKDTEWWAVTYSGEGHPDTAIYKGVKLEASTDVYPGGIGALVWRDHKLYCETGIYLEYGLTRDQRARNPKFDESLYEGRDERYTYEIDPETGKAVMVATSLKEIRNRSSDEKYRVEVKESA